MKRSAALLTALILLLIAPWARALEVFAGSAATAPLKGVIADYEALTGDKVELHTGGSGAMLSQIELTGRGDLYIAGSPDFMDLAVKRDLVDPGSEARPAYLVPAICVPKGNPRKIRTLADLARPGLKVAIGRPDTVCVGLYGIETLEKAGVAASVKPNIAVHAESCEKVAQLLSMGLVDAVLGWDVFAKWDPQHIEALPPEPGAVPRIAYIAGAVVKNSHDIVNSLRFLELMVSEQGQEHFRTEGYHTDIEAARKAAGTAAPAGGRYEIPKGWR